MGVSKNNGTPKWMVPNSFQIFPSDSYHPTKILVVFECDFKFIIYIQERKESHL